MPLTRFVRTPEQIASLQQAMAEPAFLELRTLSVNFLTDPNVIAEILPAPLKPAAEARATVTVSEIGRSTSIAPFNAAGLAVACEYEGEQGWYDIAMPMSTDLAVTFGRDLYAEPKKLAEIALQQTGQHIRGTVTRHGITYIEVSANLESLRDSDRQTTANRYYFKYLPAADGNGLAADPQLIRVRHTGRLTRIAPGTGTITFRESPHDPVIDIPVLAVTGAAYSEGETHTRGELLATIPAASFLPYAFSKTDDLTVWAPAPVRPNPAR